MQHQYRLEDVRLERPSVVTIGVFDGIHRGHQALIRELVSEAHAAGRLAVAITFFPHPDILLRGLEGRYYLHTPQEKADLLGELGIDTVLTLAFNDDLRHVRAADFVDSLVDRLKLAQLWVGADFAMGYQREGNVAFLSAQGAEKGFDIRVVDLVLVDGEAISSTAIRQALEAGEVEQAANWLGRGYSVTGEIIHGEKRGRSIGIPTANVSVWSEKVIPANGVYAGWATVGGERFMAMTNIGVRPTFDGQGVTVEAHLLDFDRDIYGQTMTVTFEKRLRAEKRFNGIQELIAQIHADIEAGRAALAADL
jgi:riboflavin kinase/FMN adenylyltransferase